jgi:superoxide dismutase
MKLIEEILNFEEFKASDLQAGATQFGSGWAWLNVSKRRKTNLLQHQIKTIL